MLHAKGGYSPQRQVLFLLIRSWRIYWMLNQARLKTARYMTVVIVRKGDKRAGLVVDSLIGQMEIVIKSLGKLYQC